MKIDTILPKISNNKLVAILAILVATLIVNIVDSPSLVVASNSQVQSNIVFSPDRPMPIMGYHSQPITIVVGQSRKENELLKVKQEEIRVLESQTKSQREVVSRVDINRTEAPSSDEKRSIVKGIASKYGIDWKILEAVWEVESGKSWDRNVKSYAGAQGPMQFLPSTFRHYAEPGANINSALDSLEAGAKLLSASGASSGNVDQALFSYNHSLSYVAKVKRVADSI